MAKKPSKKSASLVKIALLQMAAAESPEVNLKKNLLAVQKAAAKGARIVCLQELYRSRYFCQGYDGENFKLAEAVPGPSTQVFSRLARENEIVIIVPVFEKRAGGIYHNSAAVIDADGRIIGHYRKMHIPDDPYFYEKFYFSPGDLGFRAFQTRYAKIGVLICWDQWFPEAARLTALAGAQILFYPTAIGWQAKEASQAAAQISAWETVQRGHAVANEIFVAAVNRVGKEGPVTFWGNSFVCGPFGEEIAKAGSRNEEILLADCDLEKIDETRQGWPFFRDRRVDAYQALSERFLDKEASLKL